MSIMGSGSVVVAVMLECAEWSGVIRHGDVEAASLGLDFDRKTGWVQDAVKWSYRTEKRKARRAYEERSINKTA